MILSTALYYEGVFVFCVLFMKTTYRVMSGFGYILRITMRPIFLSGLLLIDCKNLLTWCDVLHCNFNLLKFDFVISFADSV